MESELGRVVDALPGLVWTAFPDGRIDFLSQRWFDLTGLGPDTCRDRGWQTVVHPEDLPRLLAGWRTNPAPGAPVETEARLRGSNGKYRWFLFRALPSANASGQVVKWCGLSTDIDERKQVEEALREDQRRAGALLTGEKQLLVMIARGRPMADILEALCRFVEGTETGSYCSIMLLDASGTKFQEVIAPTIASEFVASARGRPLNRIDGPCVSAARDNVQVIVSDVASDARWSNRWRVLAQAHKLRSCWSTPIASQVGKVLGTFALYRSVPGSPNPLQLELIEQFTNIASIAMERAQHDAVLRDSEARCAAAECELQLTIDGIPSLIATYRLDGSLIFVNQTWRDYTGYSIEDGEGTSIVHPDDATRVAQEWRTSLVLGAAIKTEARLRRADGEYRWHAIHRVPARDESGAMVKLYTMAVDIEERKCAEEALRASELESRLIVDGIPGLVVVLTPDGKFEFVNRPIIEYFGRTLEDLKLKRWSGRDGIHPEDLRRSTEQFKQSISSGEPFEFELRCKRFDGVYRWFQSRGFPVRDTNGRIFRWYNLLIDIDERKRAEEALRQSEARLSEAERELRLTLDSIPVITWRGAANGYVQQLNKRWFEYTGTTTEQVRGRRWKSCVHPDDLQPLVDAGTKYVAAGVPVDTEARLRRFDGVYRWFLFRPAPARDEAGDIVAWYGTIIDIEDRKRAEEALRQGEARLAEAERELQLTIDTIPAIVARYRRDGSPDFINQTWRTYTGLSNDMWRGQHWNDTWRGQHWVVAVHPDDLPRNKAAWRAHLSTGQPFDMEQRLRRADGEYRWFFIRRVPLRDENGEVIRWYAAAHDIEDRKRAEEKALAAERDLKLTVDMIPALAWSARPDGSAEFFNQQYLDYLGIPPDQALDWGWAAAVHADDVSELARKWQSLLASGRPGEAEARLRRHDGEYRWFLFRAKPLRDDNGNIVKWYGFNTDIEDRRRVEEKLRRSEAFLAKAQEVSLTGSFSFNSVTKQSTLSDELYRIFEFESGISVPLKLLASRYHPEDRLLIEEVAARVRGGAPDFDYEHRLLMPDGSIKHIHVVGHKEGNGPEYFGAVQDITQRRVAEAALDKARSELAHVNRVMSLGALTASIAHEINQPLAGIITNASTSLRMLAADPPNVAGARETARRTIRDGNRAADIIARLRALFSKKATATETMDLNEATREVLALVLGDLLRNRVSLRTELDDDHPLLVTGDRVQLQQVIMNLVRNASDAMRDINDRPRHLLVKAERDEEGAARLTIRDAGVGLEPKVVGRLFDAFYTTKSDGMGIGLSVSRSIVESHGGKLWAEANDGPGATFAFSLPRLAGSETDDRTGDADWTPGVGSGSKMMRNA